jgi:hypothetical protein
MRAWILPCMLVSAAIAQNSSNVEESSVRVIGGGKGWLYNGRELARNQRVPVTATLSGTGATDLVLDCGQSGWYAYSCGGSTCRVPVCSSKVDGVVVRRVDPYAWSGPAHKATLGEMLHSFFEREPKSAETLGVRASGSPNDALVMAASEGIHWGPALNRVLEGRYCFDLMRLPVAAREVTQTFTIDWNREVDREGVARVLDVKPGTYIITKGRPDVDGPCHFDDAESGAAWVVVVPQARFESLSSQWKSYSTGLRQLEQSGTSPDVVATVRHAVLSSLADSIGNQ